MKTIEFIIQGMDCPSCVVGVDRTLRKNKNIISSKINFQTGKATIEAEDTISKEEIITKELLRSCIFF